MADNMSEVRSQDYNDKNLFVQEKISLIWL